MLVFHNTFWNGDLQNYDDMRRQFWRPRGNRFTIRRSFSDSLNTSPPNTNIWFSLRSNLNPLAAAIAASYPPLVQIPGQ